MKRTVSSTNVDITIEGWFYLAETDLKKATSRNNQHCRFSMSAAQKLRMIRLKEVPGISVELTNKLA